MEGAIMAVDLAQKPESFDPSRLYSLFLLLDLAGAFDEADAPEGIFDKVSMTDKEREVARKLLFDQEGEQITNLRRIRKLEEVVRHFAHYLDEQELDPRLMTADELATMISTLAGG